MRLHNCAACGRPVLLGHEYILSVPLSVDQATFAGESRAVMVCDVACGSAWLNAPTAPVPDPLPGRPGAA